MTRKDKSELYQHLTQFITQERKHLIEEKSLLRTRFVTIALENIYQPHNASAVLRTADCLGIQDVHIIENRNTYSPNPDVSLGADKWLTLKKYHNSETESSTTQCINHLKKEGYQILATTPHTSDILLTELEINQKTVFLFGTEKDGLSQEAIHLADGYVRIPMYGFSESYNISVSAAITLFTIMEKLRKSTLPWQLSDSEIIELRLQWATKSVKKSDLIIEKFLDSL
ncbi:MAG: TrmH family RNA methyltransferase [Bacteroidetes bacterium]|nr:MAG: TrmH family RNA methyltransferase [Bacteroidota bacterium]